MNNGATSRHEQFSRAEIAKVLGRYRQSGLGLVEFAQEQGIPAGRLHYWVYEKGGPRPRNSSRLAVSKPVFQEIKVGTVLPPVDSWAAEVSLPGGLDVRFSQRAAAEWIGSVVQALGRPC
jgi:hypothetical protein